MARSPWIALGLASALGLVGAAWGCDGTAVNADVSRTSTVSLGRARAVRFVMPVLVDVVGTPLGSDLLLSLTGVVTASTSSKAAAVAESVHVEVDLSMPEIADVTLAGLQPGARFTGTLQAQVPEGLDLAIAAEPGARVLGMAKAVELRTGGGVQVTNARGTVTIETGGGAVVFTPLLQSTALTIQATGAVIVHLPTTPSASFDVAGTSIAITHPKLPATGSAATTYRQTVNGGLAQVMIRSGGGVSLEP